MNKQPKTIIVNATALISGGALTILEMFLDEIKTSEQIYYIFVAIKLKDSFYKHPNIKVIGVDTANIFKRIYWDWVGLKHWVNTNNIIPDIVLSLQNTAVNLNGTNQFIYLHQAIPFHPKQWSFLKKEERNLAFYKYLYPFFMKNFLQKKATFLVQTTWMKEACAKRFKTANIKILPPRFNNFKVDKVGTLNLAFKYNLFYPANASIFKNHSEIIKALYAIKKEHPSLSLGLYLTLTKQDNLKLSALIKKYKLTRNVIFLGTISKETMKKYYKSCQALVFPSYIESFGLPLREAQCFGKYIVVADEPYAREVLKNYSSVLYAKTGETREWKEKILEVIKLNNSNINFYDNKNDSLNDDYTFQDKDTSSFEEVLLKE